MCEPPSDQRQLLSSLPAVGILLQREDIRELCVRFPEQCVHNCVRKTVEEIREQVLSGKIRQLKEMPSESGICARIRERVEEKMGNRLMRAVNAAGVILHTGLGRAPLPPSAQEALMEAVARYCLLATDRETGKRGDRNRHNDDLLQELTGAESSLVVNNNAAALMLALNSFGADREAIISRGELVEIGGMFRIPDVMRRSGTVMVEVGTTNKTHLKDYQEAITDKTSILLKVHTSNYRIEGFHKEVLIKELHEIARERNLVVIYDIGSGALVDLRKWGLDYEPTVPEAIKDGADIVTFSGDKLVGGPQCGVIVGRKEYIDRMKQNPLVRALRVDKLILSALRGTLKLFLDPDRLPETHPIYQMITEPLASVNRRAQRLMRRLEPAAADVCSLSLEDGMTEMGSGALPARGIPTRVVALQPIKSTADALARALRLAQPPVFTRIEGDRVLLDARTISDGEVKLIENAFKKVKAEVEVEVKAKVKA